jgi:PEP-CTERM motif
MKTSQHKYMPALALGILGLPPAGVYLSTDIHAIYGGPALQFLLSLPEHAPLANEVIRHPGGNGAAGDANDEIEDFGSTLTAMMDVLVNGNSITGGPQPIFASGPLGSVTTLVHDRLLSPTGTGTFDTEMLALSLSGTSPLGPFMIRESPTKQSLGQTSVTDIGGGLYQIDSFFDVFTELSIDGGATWMPDTDSVLTGQRVNLVPEPTSMSLLAAGFVGAVGFVRRRRATTVV